jgi:hypothetical protein
VRIWVDTRVELRQRIEEAAMNRQKIVLGIAIALGVLLAASVTWAASTVVRDGLVTVRVPEGGRAAPHLSADSRLCGARRDACGAGAARTAPVERPPGGSASPRGAGR